MGVFFKMRTTQSIILYADIVTTSRGSSCVAYCVDSRYDLFPVITSWIYSKPCIFVWPVQIDYGVMCSFSSFQTRTVQALLFNGEDDDEDKDHNRRHQRRQSSRRHCCCWWWTTVLMMMIFFLLLLQLLLLVMMLLIVLNLLVILIIISQLTIVWPWWRMTGEISW